MKVIRMLLAIVALASAGAWASPAAAKKMVDKPRPTPARQVHACADAARATALQLLRLHSDNDKRAAIDGRVRKAPQVRTPNGAGKLDVLEVKGFVYKAAYRIRVLYLPGQGCARAGFELIEVGAGR